LSRSSQRDRGSGTYLTLLTGFYFVTLKVSHCGSIGINF